MDGQKKMLVVDDLHVNRAILNDIFKSEFDILQAKDGIEAMDIIHKFKNEIVVILLDLHMPLKNGYEVLSEIKNNEQLKDIPVIVTTANHDVKNEVKVLQIGADDFVIQPIEPEIIKCRVHNVVSKKEMDLIKEQNRILEITQKNEEIYKIIVKQVELLIFEWNPEHGVEYKMEGVSQFIFVMRAFVLGEKTRVLKVIEAYGEDESKFIEVIKAAREGISTKEMLIRLKKITGEFVWCKLNINCFYNDKNELIRVIGTINNVDENVKAQNELVYRAEYDEIAGCYNRRTYHSKIEQMFRDYPSEKFVILRMNIKRFKVINEVYGTKVGNFILKEVAKVINNCIGEDSVCGRNHSDIFGICITYNDVNDILTLIHKIEEGAQKVLPKFKLEFSFGICQVDDIGLPVNQLCDFATLALSTIKDSVLINYAFYDDDIKKRAKEEREMEEEMKSALANGEFVVYLQPKHNISTGEIVGAEALVRWNHPQKGLILPNKFIPLFEKNGFIILLDEYIWEETCKLMKKWLDQGEMEVPISVNVSRMHVYDNDFCDKLVSITKRYQLPNELLELELTESTFIENAAALLEIMERVRELGFRFSLDDFGTGYSSLSILKDAPISVIKLDREFFNETNNKTESRTIVKYIIEMTNSLGISVVAEGVETKKISDDLLEMGCLIAQGYYFSKPMPHKEFEKILFDNNYNIVNDSLRMN